MCLYRGYSPAKSQACLRTAGRNIGGSARRAPPNGVLRRADSCQPRAASCDGWNGRCGLDSRRRTRAPNWRRRRDHSASRAYFTDASERRQQGLEHRLAGSRTSTSPCGRRPTAPAVQSLSCEPVQRPRGLLTHHLVGLVVAQPLEEPDVFRGAYVAERPRSA